jgi:hypothetical protein
MRSTRERTSGMNDGSKFLAAVFYGFSRKEATVHSLELLFLHPMNQEK